MKWKDIKASSSDIGYLSFLFYKLYYPLFVRKFEVYDDDKLTCSFTYDKLTGNHYLNSIERRT